MMQSGLESVLRMGSKPAIAVALLLMTPVTSGLAEEMLVVGEQSHVRLGDVETRDLLSTVDAVPGARFVHTATADNISFNYTLIDHPLTNNNPDAIVLITQNWNPGGVGNTYNDHAVGVWYDSSTGKWGIFNQDSTSSMPEGAAFNVLIPTAGAEAFVHSAEPANIVSNWTYLDHPLINDNPDAIVFVTQNWNPGGTAGTYNDHPVGVWYSNSAGRWGIFNQDSTSSMPDGADFNVLVVPLIFSDGFESGDISAWSSTVP